MNTERLRDFKRRQSFYTPKRSRVHVENCAPSFSIRCWLNFVGVNLQTSFRSPCSACFWLPVQISLYFCDVMEPFITQESMVQIYMNNSNV